MAHVKEYELVPHTADLKMYAYGKTLEELFRNALRGMFASIKPQGPSISYEGEAIRISKYSVEHHVVLQSTDRETLLIDFLSEALYLADTNNEAYFDARFKELSESELDATIFGADVTGFEIVEIKAVTYHDLQLELIDGQWRATLVFDI